MNPTQYPQDIYDALYTDETGEVIGLDEVQLLDPIPQERITRLIDSLSGDDLYLSYQCALVLAAWGIEQGVHYLRHLIATRIDQLAEFEPHRLWGEDNVYDVISEALYIGVLSDYNKVEINSMVKEILELYGEAYFESKLKHVLIKLNEPELTPAIKQAMQLALKHERYYQASQLLPVLAKYDKVYAFAQVDAFQKLIAKDKRIQYNLEEMQTPT